MATTSTKADVFYPESDGEPMGETLDHRDANIDLILALQDWFADDPLAYASGDEFLYWVEGNPRFVVSPDVWVTRGIDKTIRRQVYKTWLENGKGPEFVLELTSRSTRRIDLGKKFRIYRDDLKVREYFLFDPLDEYLDPILQGYRLVDGEYQRIEPVQGRLPSEILGLHLEANGKFVRLFNPATGLRLLNRLERLEREKQARINAENARINAENARINAENARIAAENARINAENALQGKDIELDRLRQELEALRAAQEAQTKPRPKPKRK